MSVVDEGERSCPGCRQEVTVENILVHMDCLENLMTAFRAARLERGHATSLEIEIEVNDERLRNSLLNYRAGMESLMVAYGEGIRRHNREAIRMYARHRGLIHIVSVALGAFVGSFIGLGLINLLF